MRRLFYLIVGIVIFIWSFSLGESMVYASCAQISITEQKNMADVIAVGTAIEVTESSTRIDVETYYKGEEQHSEIVVSGKQSNDAITSVDVTFEEGKTYLLFLKKVVYTGALLTDNCSGTRELANGLTSEERQVLGSGTAAPVIPRSVQEDTNSKQSEESNPLLFFSVGGMLVVVLGTILLLLKQKRIPR